MNERQILNFLRTNAYLREASVPVCSKKIEKVLGHFLREQDIIQYMNKAYYSEMGIQTESEGIDVINLFSVNRGDYE